MSGPRVLGAGADMPHNFEIFVGGNPNARNILVLTEYINATYFISFDIPLRLLHKNGKLNFGVVSQKRAAELGPAGWNRWVSEFEPDYVIFSRYGQPEGLDILQIFKSFGIPLIYHIDDDLLNLPESLGGEILQRHGALADTRRELLAQCDIIYVSTAELAENLGRTFPTQRLFHGIYAPYLGATLQPPATKTRPYPVIGYMGSKGHRLDLDLVVPALVRLLEERPELHFEVFGSISLPAELVHFGDRVASHPVQKSYSEFLSSLANLGWTIGLAPLVNEPFNRCKAPTKFIEYTTASIPTAASDISVYARTIPQGGGLLVSDPDWYAALNMWLDSPDSRKSALRAAVNHCAQAFNPNRLADQILELFKLIRPDEEIIRIFVGADRSQKLAIKVLEHSIKRHTNALVKVIPMVDLEVPLPKDPRNGQRTGFSFSRFCIPELAGYRGKAIYMDADMQVFKDIRGLWNLPFNGRKVLVQESVKYTEETLKKVNAPSSRKKQCAVMLLDCENLDWEIRRIVQDMDDGKYDYSRLMDELCLEPASNVGYNIPFEWNSLEHYGPETCLIHYTDMGTQPWVSTRNPNGHVWMAEVREMLANGSLKIESLKNEVKLGFFRPSLIREVRYGHRVPACLRSLFNTVNAFLDKMQGYVPHKAVYEAKNVRNQAVIAYQKGN